MKTNLFFLLLFFASIILFNLPFNSFAQRDRPKKTIEREKPIDVQIKKPDRTIPNKNDPPDRQQHTGVKIERPKERVPDPPIIKRKDPIIKQKEPEHIYIPQDVYIEAPPPVIIEMPYIPTEDYFDPLDPPIPLDPPDPIKVYNPKLEGIDKLEEKDYFGALKDFNIAISNDTSDYELYYYRGLTHLRIKNYLDAIDDFDIYLEYFFYEAEGFLQRGWAKFYLHEKQFALEDFRIAADMGDKRVAASIIRRFYN